MNLFSVPSAVARAIGSLCLTKATLAINAGSAATFKSTGTITYLIDGAFKTKAALSAQAFSSGEVARLAFGTGEKLRWLTKSSSRSEPEPVAIAAGGAHFWEAP